MTLRAVLARRQQQQKLQRQQQQQQHKKHLSSSVKKAKAADAVAIAAAEHYYSSDFERSLRKVLTILKCSRGAFLFPFLNDRSWKKGRRFPFFYS